MPKTEKNEIKKDDDLSATYILIFKKNDEVLITSEYSLTEVKNMTALLSTTEHPFYDVVEWEKLEINRETLNYSLDGYSLDLRIA